jgi:hypothetical protein
MLRAMRAQRTTDVCNSTCEWSDDQAHHCTQRQQKSELF